MQRCPNCGKYMVKHVEYNGKFSNQLWNCSCGYSTRMDRTGLRSSDVSNRYMFDTPDRDEVMSWRR